MPTPTTTPPPPPTPRPLFLQVDRPQNLDVVRGLPEVAVSGSTLPGSVMEIVYSSKDGERGFTLQPDGNGDFSETVPLAEGTNVVEIVSRHGASTQPVRQFLQLTYDPTPPALSLDVWEPEDGATVSHRLLTVVGETAPDAQVVINDTFLVRPDEEGRWEATMSLQRGPNEIRITATLESQTVNATINIEYEPGQG